jgi:hypothetical protein
MICGGFPRAVPSDGLAGLRDAARTPFTRLVVALVAVHALSGTEMRSFLTTDLRLASGTLEIRRGLLQHTVHLENSPASSSATGSSTATAAGRLR